MGAAKLPQARLSPMLDHPQLEPELEGTQKLTKMHALLNVSLLRFALP